MATTVQNKVTPDWFIPPDEEEKPNPARYRIRPLDGMEFLEVTPNIILKDGYIGYDGKGMQTLLRIGLLGWDNHTDPETKEAMEFSHESVRRIHPFRLKVIAQEIAKRSQLSEAEVKN